MLPLPKCKALDLSKLPFTGQYETGINQSYKEFMYECHSQLIDG